MIKIAAVENSGVMAKRLMVSAGPATLYGKLLIKMKMKLRAERDRYLRNSVDRISHPHGVYMTQLADHYDYSFV
jgi:hypothetical protein